MNLLGDDLLPQLVLALGAAMALGSVVALVRPPSRRGDTDLARPPVARSLAMIGVGLVAAVWAIATLTAGPASEASSGGRNGDGPLKAALSVGERSEPV